MDEFLRYLSANPVALMAMALLALLIFYFLMKKIIKLVLIFGIVLLCIAGYLYYKAPNEFSDKIQTTIEDVRTHTGNIMEKSKGAIEKGKDFAEKVDRIVEKGSELFADKK